MFIDSIGTECLGKEPMKDAQGETWYCACKTCEAEEQDGYEPVKEPKKLKRTKPGEIILGAKEPRKRRTKAEMEAERNNV